MSGQGVLFCLPFTNLKNGGEPWVNREKPSGPVKKKGVKNHSNPDASVDIGKNFSVGWLNKEGARYVKN